MRTRGWVLFGAGAVLAACGLDVVGSAGSPEITTADAATAPGTLPAEPEPERLGDGTETPAADAAPPDETPIDAGPIEAGPCGPPVLVDNFAQGLGKWTHYGGVEQRTTGNNAYARLIAEGVKSRAAGLFWLPNVNAKGFKASFAYFVSTPYRDWYMGDGLTFTWLTSTGAAPLGTGAVNGQGLGIQPGVTGHAFALDEWKNSSIGDLDGPSFSFVRIDPTRGNPGSYDWHLAKKGPYYKDQLYDAWRTIEITVENGKASAVFRFTPTGARNELFKDVPVDTSGNIVALGFTASTGGADAMGFFVDTVSFELTNASCN